VCVWGGHMRLDVHGSLPMTENFDSSCTRMVYSNTSGIDCGKTSHGFLPMPEAPVYIHLGAVSKLSGAETSKTSKY